MPITYKTSPQTQSLLDILIDELNLFNEYKNSKEIKNKKIAFLKLLFEKLSPFILILFSKTEGSCFFDHTFITAYYPLSSPIKKEEIEKMLPEHLKRDLTRYREISGKTPYSFHRKSIDYFHMQAGKILHYEWKEKENFLATYLFPQSVNGGFYLILERPNPGNRKLISSAFDSLSECLAKLAKSLNEEKTVETHEAKEKCSSLKGIENGYIKHTANALIPSLSPLRVRSSPPSYFTCFSCFYSPQVTPTSVKNSVTLTIKQMGSSIKNFPIACFLLYKTSEKYHIFKNHLFENFFAGFVTIEEKLLSSSETLFKGEENNIYEKGQTYVVPIKTVDNYFFFYFLFLTPSLLLFFSTTYLYVKNGALSTTRKSIGNQIEKLEKVAEQKKFALSPGSKQLLAASSTASPGPSYRTLRSSSLFPSSSPGSRASLEVKGENEPPLTLRI